VPGPRQTLAGQIIFSELLEADFDLGEPVSIVTEYVD
jgi:hypothetical protein